MSVCIVPRWAIFFLIRKKTIYKSEILTKEWVQASTLQRGYVYLIKKKGVMYAQDGTYSQNQLYQKKIGKSLHCPPKKKKVLTIASLIRWRDVFSPLKTLIFLSLQRVQKITCGIDKMHFSLAFLPKAPSQAKRWSLPELETTQGTPKQLKANSQRALANDSATKDD